MLKVLTEKEKKLGKSPGHAEYHDDTDFLKIVITGDELWFHKYDKVELLQWKFHILETKTKTQ